MSDTIFARASGAGKAGVAVFRLSGPRAFDILGRLVDAELSPRRAVYVTVRDSNSGHTIDEGLALCFPGPNSFTGEDVAELQLHGSHAVEIALYEALSAAGGRPAEAGEFTRRALINGKLDLAQVEGLSDLLDAETNLQRQQALGQLGGRLSHVAEGLRERLLAISAPLEADIDFPDEEDVPAAVAARAGPAIDAMKIELRHYLSLAVHGARIREGIEVALIGAPNVGKSSLLNFLAGDERAIVSDQPGTTRDVVEARLELAGLPVTIADTAGLRRQTTDDIEREGMARSVKRAENADIRIHVIDVSRETKHQGSAFNVNRSYSVNHDDVSRETVRFRTGTDFILYNKIDLLENEIATTQDDGFFVSATTGAGLEMFLDALAERIREMSGRADDVLLSRARHVAAVKKALTALNASEARLEAAPELAAEDIRMAARALGEITGRVDVEEVLGEIFSSFCIGK